MFCIVNFGISELSDEKAVAADGNDADDSAAKSDEKESRKLMLIDSSKNFVFDNKGGCQAFINLRCSIGLVYDYLLEMVLKAITASTDWRVSEENKARG
jgi:hypothetical protein